MSSSTARAHQMELGPTWHGDPVLNANHCSAACQTPVGRVTGSLADVLGGLLDDLAQRADLAARGAARVRAERTWDTNVSTRLGAHRDLGVALGE